MADIKPILLTVIIPAYNAVDYLERCIDSIRKQTLTSLEIIIVDDGSTDNTGALAEKIAMMDKRVRVFHKENGGSSSARNLGIDNANGEYIGFVDADDYIEPEMYEKMLSVAIKENFLMVQISRDEIAEDGTRLPDVCIPPQKPQALEKQEIVRELLLHKGDCSFCTRVSHKSLFEQLRFPEGELNEDFLLLLQMISQVPYVAILPDQDYHVYYKMGSNSRTDDPDCFPRVFTDIVINADRAKEIVDEQYPELEEEAFRFGMFQRLEYMLHIPISMMNKDNLFYLEVKDNLRKNMFAAQSNSYLTQRDKKYILILGTAPKLARKIHKIKMKGHK